jgi:ferredoxin
MTKRDIVLIDEERCNGCGKCVPNCHEGALQIIDGKARLVSDLFCDGLGACIGYCPKGAISIVKREAKPYNEIEVLKHNIIPAGKNTLKAHLNHLKDHGEDEYLNQALNYLKKEGVTNPLQDVNSKKEFQGCPGSRMIDASDFKIKSSEKKDSVGKRPSELRQWPVQLHLISPYAPYYRGKEVVLAADCTAYALGDFHKDYLRGKSLAIACPKLDSEQEIYEEKIKELIDSAEIKSLTVLIMQVPCCSGLLHLTERARDKASRKIPISYEIVGINGDVIEKSKI